MALNESANLPGCLASIKGADEIVVVVDDRSEDDTAALARAAGAKVAERKFDSFDGQRNFAQTLAEGDWAFHLDADERFSPGLMASIRRHMELWPGAAGRVVRHNFAFGRRHRFGVLKPDRVTRLFPRGSVTWTGPIHERPAFEGPVRPLSGHLDHLTFSDWDQHKLKLYRYPGLWAASAWAQGRRAGPLPPWLRAGAGFLKMFLLNLGFLGGPAAWALCWRHGLYTLTKYRNLAALSRLGVSRPGPGRT
jgi:glycosyltransferase involved in cell wall biosynthesis